MSSNSSVTSRESGPEGAAKRQKTDSKRVFDYGTDIILLGKRVDDPPNFRPIAHVSASQYQAILGEEIYAPSASAEPIDMKYKGVTIGHNSFDCDESVVKFLAHWIHERNARDSLDTCLPEDKEWIEFFFIILNFCVDQDFLDFHDSLIDCLIDWMRERTQEGTSEHPINKAFSAVDGHDEEQCWRLSHYTTVLQLLAILHLHHLSSDLLSSAHGDCLGDEVTILDKIRYYALDYCLEAHKHQGFTKLRQDPLADDFDQYCLYHNHGKDKTCYRTKQR